MANTGTPPQNAPTSPSNALESERIEADKADQQMQSIANEVAQRSSARIQKFEEGKGVISKSDGH